MIEFILARPFILLFSISAIVYSIILKLYDSQCEFYPGFIVPIVFIISAPILFSKQAGFAQLFILIAFVICINVIYHIHENHIHAIKTEDNNPIQSILTVHSASTYKTKMVVDARLISAISSPLVRINIPIKKFQNPLFYNDTIVCTLNLEEIKPSDFRYFNNFNNYLLNQHINYKANLADSIVSIRKYTQFSILSFSQKIAQRCNEIFLATIPDETTANLMIALLLGDKTSLDKKIKNDFINTGTAHILAVSGLHLGMIYGLLNALVKLFKRKSHFRKSNKLEVLLLLILIWLFSFITGLSASVIRAAVMLSLFELGQMLKRNSDGINSLFGCGFLMIFYDPCTIYDIGFQLSFMAVLSIMLFNPIIIRIVKPENKYLVKIRDMLAVTLSVQILVTPISIYYFQQFPIYFIFSNLLWVPLSFLIMIVGIVLILFYAIFPPISILLGQLCIYLCKIGLLGFDVISYLPASKFWGLWISKSEVIIYLISSLLIFFWLKFNYNLLLFISISMFLLIPIIHLVNIEIDKRNNELIVFQEENALQLEIRTGDTIYSSNASSKFMSNYRIAHHISTIQEINNQNEIKSVLTKNNIEIKTIDPNSCEESDCTQIPVKKSMLIRSITFKNSSPIQNNDLMEHQSGKSSLNNCKSSKYSVHVIKTDAFFILKF